MIRRVVAAAFGGGAKEVRVVVGFGEALVRQVVEPMGAQCFAQKNQLGTADAVRAAKPEALDGLVVILNGDHPLITADDIKGIVREHISLRADLGVVTSVLKNPGNFGRVVKSQGRVRAVVEAKDAGAETLQIREVNTGLYVTSAETLNTWLPKIESANKQNEFYLTDLISLIVENGGRVEAISREPRVAFGVNTQRELALSTRKVVARKIGELMNQGVIFIAPEQVYIEDEVEIGEGAVVYPGAFLRGATKIGSFTVLEPNVFISSCQIGTSVQIKAGSYLEQSEVHNHSEIGPYAHLRPGTVIGEGAKVGNFVEMKKVKFGARAKASHLTYLGDAEIGEDTNIGCGTITCNYAVDRKKYVTKIGKGVFVGSDSQFVAPVTIGDNAVIGSGSTITKDVPENALAVARSRQIVKENYRKSKTNATNKTDLGDT